MVGALRRPRQQGATCDTLRACVASAAASAGGPEARRKEAACRGALVPRPGLCPYIQALPQAFGVGVSVTDICHHYLPDA